MEGTQHAQFGIIGLGVMGANLALNIEQRGFRVVVWNHESQLVARFVAEHAGKRFVGVSTLEEFVDALERPRRIMLMITAGEPVDAMIGVLRPLLGRGDVIIDGGNSWFRDTRRREATLREEGIAFLGTGVSGGERGARLGPSLMPGGDSQAYQVVRPVFEAIAARTPSGPCVSHMGPDGAGHFVKMVHNGIEYGDMQLIAEVYDAFRRFGFAAHAIADVFESWNQGPLESFLVELTARVLRRIDEETALPLVDLIVDAAGQKGTGKWTAQAALDLGVPIPTLAAAIDARNLSAMKQERVLASQLLTTRRASHPDTVDGQWLIEATRDALFCSRLCAYAQGMNLIRAASAQYGWNVSLREVARIWKGGCILRARILNGIMDAYERNPDLPSVFLDETFRILPATREMWGKALATAQLARVPSPALAASLAYFDGYFSERLPQNLIQAQRDAFGAHGYQRIDRLESGFVHTDWLAENGKTSGS